MDFEVSRADLHECRVVDAPVPEPAPGQVRLRVDAFALTANNITYGLMGESLDYWGHFPSAEPEDWGRIPVWGLVDVEASTRDELPVGTRIYGYLPMSTHLVVTPDRVGGNTFVDASPHRANMAASYTRYTLVAGDPLHNPEHEDHRMLLWPLFATGFVIDDLLDDNEFFGSGTVVCSSASSKTAISAAFLIDRRKQVELVGLTSPGNSEFVERLGIYDRVVTYDDVASLPVAAATFVDIAGDAAVREAVHRHYGNDLAYSMAVGATHWDVSGTELGAATADLPGPPPTMFFAPTQIAKRAQDWGPGGLGERMAPAWRSFVEFADGWLQIEHGRGPEAVERVYRELLDGRTDPAVGHVLSL